MIDQLHKHDLALNSEHDLLLLFVGVVDGHTAGDERMLGDDLNSSTLLRFDVLGNLNASWCAVSARALLCVIANDGRTGRASANRLSNFPVSDHSALAVVFRAPGFLAVGMGRGGRRIVSHGGCVFAWIKGYLVCKRRCRERK